MKKNGPNIVERIKKMVKKNEMLPSLLGSGRWKGIFRKVNGSRFTISILTPSLPTFV
jgi:hypothetical protein